MQPATQTSHEYRDTICRLVKLSPFNQQEAFAKANFDAQHPPQRCANAQGFSLHAEVRCAINQRHKLEQLCRYITRPAIAHERLKRNSASEVRSSQLAHRERIAILLEAGGVAAAMRTQEGPSYKDL
jgi:hypothetical protein